MNAFAKRIYQLRKEKGLTQAELAEQLGISNKAVSKWETGESYPETAQLLSLSELFDITVDDLLKGKTESQTSEMVADMNKHKQQTTNITPEMYDTQTGNTPPPTVIGYETADKDGVKRVFATRHRQIIGQILDACCAIIMLVALIVYVCLGAILNLWHPYWVIMPCAAFICGIIGSLNNIGKIK